MVDRRDHRSPVRDKIFVKAGHTATIPPFRRDGIRLGDFVFLLQILCP